MSGGLAREVAGESPWIRLPHSAVRRGGITYVKLLESVTPDPVWGGWRFEGRLLRPGSLVEEASLPPRALLIECAGTGSGGRGHNRPPTLYILWRYQSPPGEWRELARASSCEHDWTIVLGPIARAELDPPRPVLVDPRAAAARVVQALDRELELLEFKARVLVVRAVEDRLAMAMAG